MLLLSQTFLNYDQRSVNCELQDRCLECKRPMTQAGHYTAYLCCTKCRYSTCCSRAINIHGLLFHDRVSGLYWHWTQGGRAHWTVNYSSTQSFISFILLLAKSFCVLLFKFDWLVVLRYR